MKVCLQFGALDLEISLIKVKLLRHLDNQQQRQSVKPKRLGSAARTKCIFAADLPCVPVPDTEFYNDF